MSAENELARLLASGGETIATVIAEPRFEVKIVYTRIDRDPNNRPEFTTSMFGAEPPSYFYPASTIKLPTALVALEKLEQLKASGVGLGSPMMTGAAYDWQSAVTGDPSAPSGMPSLGNYIRKIFLVSDNDAYNRLYEFVGVDSLNSNLESKGYAGVRIFHRLGVRREPWHGRHSNPIVFLDAGGKVIHQQAAIESEVDRSSPTPIPLGAAFIDRDGVHREEPKNFAGLSALPLGSQHEMMKALIFPEAVSEHWRWEISAENREFVLRAMACEPGDSGSPKYRRSEFPDHYTDFLFFGAEPEGGFPTGLKSYGKSGMAYGYLIDNAYFIDPDRDVEFLLSAVVHVNANRTFNDDNYEYNTVGLPFMRDLGRLIYEHEVQRPRARKPDFEKLFR